MPDAEGYAALVADTAGPLGLALAALPPAGRAAVVHDAETALAPFAAGEGFEVPGVALAAAAR